MVFIIDSAIIVCGHYQNSSVGSQILHHFISILEIHFEVGGVVPYKLFSLSQKAQSKN
jgi:hypothetical protein